MLDFGAGFFRSVARSFEISFRVCVATMRALVFDFCKNRIDRPYTQAEDSADCGKERMAVHSRLDIGNGATTSVKHTLNRISAISYYHYCTGGTFRTFHIFI